MYESFCTCNSFIRSRSVSSVGLKRRNPVSDKKEMLQHVKNLERKVEVKGMKDVVNLSRKIAPTPNAYVCAQG
jgi:hypothetical protein